MEEFINGNSQIVTDTEHSTECIRSQDADGLSREGNSIECPFSAKDTYCSNTVNTSISARCSYFSFLYWSLPDSVSTPFTLKQAPVVISFSICSSKFAKFHYNCTLFIVEPSFSAIKLTCLLPCWYRTQPFTLTISRFRQVNNLCLTNLFHKTVIIT